MKYIKSSILLGFVGITLFVAGGCQTLQEFANLRLIKFDFERVARVFLADIDVSKYSSYRDLNPNDLLKLSRAVARESLPVEFDLHLQAENPQENGVQARLVSMEWELFLDQKETVKGVYNDEVVLPSGVVQNIPIHIELDLVDFFGSNLEDLVNVALGIAGYSREPVEVMLKARPIIRTSVGEIRYPQPITLVRKDVGPQARTSGGR